MSESIGAEHAFHDAAFAAGWAERFVPTPERLQLFATIHDELMRCIPRARCIVELGIGPGYLAEYLLDRNGDAQYLGIDFSAPMLEIARQRLHRFLPRVRLVTADLVAPEWWAEIPAPVDAIVSTWALHDLGSQEDIAAVYADCMRLLRNGGLLLNGDFIKPDNTRYEYEPGRFEISKHLELLRSVGFAEAQCLVLLEHEIEAPTAAQNYACFKAVV